MKVSKLKESVKREEREYSNGGDRPLGAYLVVMSLYGGAVGGLSFLVRRSGRQLPDGVDWSDIALFAAATHKVSRLLAKAPVTSPLRAPFARYKGTSGDAELQDQSRGRGLRHAVGELVTCPFCLSQWIATALAFGRVLAPRQTRFVAALFTALAGADFLQFARAKAEAAA